MTGMMDDYAVATAGGLAKALADRRIGAVELFETAVAAIEAKDGPVNAVAAAAIFNAPTKPPRPPTQHFPAASGGRCLVFP